MNAQTAQRRRIYYALRPKTPPVKEPTVPSDSPLRPYFETRPKPQTLRRPPAAAVNRPGGDR